MDMSEKYIRMCALANEIQYKWSYKNGDYVYDTIDGDAGVWYWLPRHDQLQEICKEFFIQNLKISEFEAFLRFLEWYAGCLRQTSEDGLKNSDYGFIDSSEELLLDNTMIMMHGKKWDGEKWVKALEGYTPKPQKSPLGNYGIKNKVFL
jgi:hypothetical protein